VWTKDSLHGLVQEKLRGYRLIVVSNREPYIHRYSGGQIECERPASGMAAALDPIMRACGGTWIAHGSGDADRLMVDDHDRLEVPPEDPQYTLRRVWLSRQEEQGYYYGLANACLWPLCHVVYTRPVFHAHDWKRYREVNALFCKAILEEAGDAPTFVFIQDYHFALLPRMVKEQRPDARVAIFWHIPWPNAEAFAICPWQRELLDGMLGADLIGFHIQAHCNNFLATVDRTLESRIDWEHFAVTRRDRTTSVRPYPISVAISPDHPPDPEIAATVDALFREVGGRPRYLGIGVDRVDYTKGIPERLRGIERLFELYPEYQGHFTFLQIGAPSRTRIKRYQEFMIEVQEEIERINRKFRAGAWRPIVFAARHHSHAEVDAFYREASVCVVTSLHDGMNLVAKEYVAARHDEQGVLILSRFTGASHELTDALMVNPYDTEELAQTLHTALSMPRAEQHTRMQHLRAAVQEHNVYRWAGTLIGDLAEVRIDGPGQPAPEPPPPVTVAANS